jgi:hypothetical protein
MLRVRAQPCDLTPPSSAIRRLGRFRRNVRELQNTAYEGCGNPV